MFTIFYFYVLQFFPFPPILLLFSPYFLAFHLQCVYRLCNISSLYKTYVKVGIVNRFPTIPLLFLLYSSNITPHPHFTFIFSLLYLYFPPILCRFFPYFLFMIVFNAIFMNIFNLLNNTLSNILSLYMVVRGGYCQKVFSYFTFLSIYFTFISPIFQHSRYC